MSLRRYLSLGLLCLLLAAHVAVVGCGREADDVVSPPETEFTEPQLAALVTALPGAPPMPEGFESYERAQAAVMSGEVPMMDVNPPLPEGVKETKDVEYGNAGGDRPLLLDLYRPENVDGPVPGIVFIHGGGWEQGNRADMRFYAVRFAAEGYVTVTISYRLADEAKFPAAVQDAKCAVRWMRANAAELGVDPDRIAVSGNSAGGHLSMMVGYASGIPELEGDGGHPGVSSVVQAVVNFYGPVDLTTAYALSRPEPAKFLGMGYDQNPDLFDMASPLHHLSKGDPPTLILHGVIDELVPIRQADRLAARLKELGIPYLYDRYPGWPHTMDLARDVNVRCRFYMNEFFNRHLRDGTADPEPAAQE